MKIIKYFLYLLFTPLWYLQLLLPRNKDIWIFGAWAGNRYSDNTRAFFTYIIKNKPEITAIWLSRNNEVADRLRKEGLQCYRINSIKGIYYSLRARYVFVCLGKRDVNPFFINGAISVQFWHGVPMKKICNDDKFSHITPFKGEIVRLLFPFVYEFNYNYYISTADIFNPLVKSAFRASDEQVISSGYPRNDIYFRNVKELPFIANLKEEYNKPKIVAYLPTHRGALVEDVDYFKKFGFNYEKFNEYLTEKNHLFIYKNHFVVHSQLEDEVSSQNRIIQISNDDIDDNLNLFLKSVDILITDYSGVYFDFLLTERPIIFAAFDLQEYISNNRELYFDYNEIACGPIAENWDEVLDAIEELTSSDQYSKSRHQYCTLFNKYLDSKNCERVYRALIEKS